jgi:putative glutamine amidotransferase
MRVAVTFGNAARLDPYLTALEAVGIEAARNPESLDALDGLLLTGGSDINPARYGESNSGSEEVNDARDALEMQLLREALAADLPVFAICRGLQMFNVVCGGTLIQRLPSTEVHRQRPPKDAEAGKHPAAHEIGVSPESRLARIIGSGRHGVNSRHHQAVDRLGEGLSVSATADEGFIEAVEYPDARFAIAVQWHPEDRILVSATDRQLFEAFAAALTRA